MSIAGRELLGSYSKRARAVAVVASAVAATGLLLEGCSEPFGAAGCEETRTCVVSPQGGAQAGAGDDASSAGETPGGANGGVSGDGRGGSGPEPSGGDPGVPTEAGAAGIGGGNEMAIAITEPSLPSGKTFSAYTATIAATGADDYSWSITNGALPAGLTLTGANSDEVQIEGTPSEAGVFPITLSVTDGTNSATIDVALTITHSVVFLSDRDTAGVNELYLSELGASTAPPVVRLSASLPNGGGVTSYAWSPDGTKVLYIAKQSVGGAPELWVSTVATPGTAKRVSASGATVSNMTWLGSGNIAAYMTSVGDAYLVDLSGAAPGPSKLAVSTAASPMNLVPSPNGSAVGVISQNTTNGEHTVTYASWDGGTPKAVTLDVSGLANKISFSYDGKLGFVITGNDGSGDWFDLASPTPIARKAQGGVWNPHAYQLLYAGLGAPNGISLGTVHGVSLDYVKIVDNSPCATLRSAVWSPDGKHALFSACDKDLRAISRVGFATMNADFSILPGDFATTAVNTNVAVTDAAWSLDVNWIALRADREASGRHDLYLARWSVPGTIYKPHPNTLGLGVTTSAFSPNSKAVAFVGTIAPQAGADLYITHLPAAGAPPQAVRLSEAG